MKKQTNVALGRLVEIMGNHGGGVMCHYLCNIVYITATASKCIVDTLDFVPHNSPMPQSSSTDRLIMGAHNMTDALKHLHPEVQFATIGDDTITALAALADIFRNKFQKPVAP
jgi:hypothetical protein